MNDYVLSRPNGVSYRISLTPEEGEAMKDDIRLGKYLEIKGDLFLSRGCSLTDVTYRPLTLGIAGEVFADERNFDGKTFWQRVVEINQARKREGKPWAFNAAVEFAKKQSGFTSPDEVMAFLESEWETVSQHNERPEERKQDPEAEHLVKAYLATEKGQAYRASIQRFLFPERR